MRSTSITASMSKLRNLRRTAMLAAANWDDMQAVAPGPADLPAPGVRPPDPRQLEIPLAQNAPQG